MRTAWTIFFSLDANRLNVWLAKRVQLPVGGMPPGGFRRASLVIDLAGLISLEGRSGLGVSVARSWVCHFRGCRHHWCTSMPMAGLQQPGSTPSCFLQAPSCSTSACFGSSDDDEAGAERPSGHSGGTRLLI